MAYSAGLYGPYTYPPGTVLVSTPVTIGDSLTLGAVDDLGCVWLMEDIEGWDAPASTTTITQRTHAHGAWLSTPYYSHREIIVTGTVRCPDARAGVMAKEKLFATISLYDTPFTMNEHGLLRTCTVRRLGEVLWKYRGHAMEADYSFSVVAADPFKYGTVTYQESMRLPTSDGGLTLPTTVPFAIEAEITANTTTISNAGNAETYPVYRINGPVTNPVLIRTSDGARMEFTIDLGVGRWIEIDTKNHTVTLDGTTQRQHVMAGTWLTLPANSTEEIMFLAATANPDAVATISWRDAWQ